MPELYPQESRDDVVRVASNREPGQLLKTIATDLGISESCLTNRVKATDVDDGAKPGSSSRDDRENRDRRKRIRLLEQEDEVLHRAAAHLSQADPPGR